MATQRRLEGEIEHIENVFTNMTEANKQLVTVMQWGRC